MMTTDQPSIFENLSPYMRTRLMLASAIIFRQSKWSDWTHGHAKLIGVVLWNYEKTRDNRFKYSKLLKRYAYGRTQNYFLLKPIVERQILIKQGNGYYTFRDDYQSLIEEIMETLKIIDQLGNQDMEG